MQKRHIKCLFWMTIVPVLLFLKGPRVTMASSALQGFIRCQPNVPRLYCIYIIPHKPKHNFKLFSFNNIISPILDYQLRLNTLKSGDEVIFTDVSGNCFKYSVETMDVVSPESVADVTNGKWPLTLVTCTLDSQNRVVVRCK